MFRSTVRKVMWVGRATVFLVGLAMIVAVVLGVATAALAGTGVGATFNLGSLNTVDQISRLVGSTDNPMLRVANNSTGTHATALDLKVDPGHAPMRVDSSTQVANLNADKVDGQEAETLLPGGDLPSGRTVRGNYSIYNVAPPKNTPTDEIPGPLSEDIWWTSDSISFGYRLPSAPSVEVIQKDASSTQNCPGTADSPEAAPGYLCVYEEYSSHLYADSSYPEARNVSRSGAHLVAFGERLTIDTLFDTWGTWAVTAP